MQNNIKISVHIKRFLSLELDEIGAIHYQIKPISGDATITFNPYLDASITNEDSNWADQFWDVLSINQHKNQSFIVAKTMKTNFHTCTFMQSKVFIDQNEVKIEPNNHTTDKKAVSVFQQKINKNQTFTIQKFGGYIVDRNHPKDQLIEAAKEVLDQAVNFGFDSLLEMQ